MKVLPTEETIKNEFPSNVKRTKSKTKENQTKIKPNHKRKEIYSCLCTKLNEKFKSIWINQLFGSPCYVSFLLTIIGISTITTIIVLSQVVNTKLNRSYFGNCTSNSDCDNLLGLSCSGQDGSCNCPAGKTKGHCDCSKGYFWNGLKCTKVMQYLDTGCSSNYMCDQSKYLSCLNKTCTCDALKIFDTVSKTCKYNYLGCFPDWSNQNSWYIVSPTYRMPFFVDSCISGCKLRGFTYSHVYWSGGYHRCYCFNSLATVTLSTPFTCEAICVGWHGEQYSCGSSSSPYYKSIYSI